MVYADILKEKAKIGLSALLNFIDNDFNLYYKEEENKEEIEIEVFYDNLEVTDEFLGRYVFNTDEEFIRED